jgi:hypothetical protein
MRRRQWRRWSHTMRCPTSGRRSMTLVTKRCPISSIYKMPLRNTRLHSRLATKMEARRTMGRGIKWLRCLTRFPRRNLTLRSMRGLLRSLVPCARSMGAHTTRLATRMIARVQSPRQLEEGFRWEEGYSARY